ncbi:tyrosine-type recombinase/integrase [Sulfurimonas sp.]|uniref:tyrosine-type recombinase/integrase n=1 Tax=Sulfurimonas sp. TaxID=2022749 RepID=UPI003D0D9648
MKLKTLSKKIPTSENGVFYKEIIDENSKVVDKIFLIRFREDNKDKLLTIGKYSAGIRIAFCKQKRYEILNSIRLGEEVPIRHKKGKKEITLQDIYEQYIKWAKNNKSSWKNNDEAMYNKHLKDALGHRSVKSLKPQDFEELKQKKLREGYKERTVVLILGIARHTINYAINNELVKEYVNPIANGRVKMPKIDNEKVGYLSKQQAKQLLEILSKRKEPLVHRLTILLLFTGARFSEVASLTWNDINFDEKLIYFKATKNGNARTIKMTPKVIEVLNELAKNKTSELIIPSRNNKQIIQMPSQWQDIVDKLIANNKNAGKHRITIHSLRHTHASWLAISGMNILEIKEQLGHKKLDMTLRYSHLIPHDRHDKTIEVFERV